MIRTKVGDKYVLKEMIEGGYNFGGEQSGHIIFLDHNTTGDGLLTALQLLYVMKKTGCKLSELSSSMIEYPQILLNAKVNNTDKGKVLENPDVKEAIESIEKQLESKGRLVIRPSGTEPLIRVMIEGKDKSKIQAYAESLVALIEQKA